MELYLQFFDIMGMELVAIIEETRVTGNNLENLNTTILTLVPKVDPPSNFGESQPIAMCNILYNLITKIISNQIKVVLGNTILSEKFGFHFGRKIMDASGIVQETLHSIKLKKLSAMILTLDLEKEYDKFDPSFLHMILVHFGLPLRVSQ